MTVKSTYSCQQQGQQQNLNNVQVRLPVYSRTSPAKIL